MADDFDAAGISWWSTARTAPSSSSSSTSFGGSSTTAAVASASCSAPIADPIDQQSASDPLIYGTDWNQSLLRNSDSTRFHSMLQENFNYLSIDSGRHHQPDHHQHMGSEQFMVDHHQQVQQQQPALSMMLQGLFEPPQPIFSYQNPSAAVGSQFLTAPPTKQQQLQFSNNPSAASVARSELYPSPLPVQFSSATAQSYEHNPSCSSLSTSKWSSDKLLRKKSSGSSSSSEPATKKSRINAPPSPLPTFKIRKEKLGDRITALQQLVSPFGKTDTASVLHEAIEYIKFLHDQVSLLSTPYLKNGDPMQHQQQSANKSEDGEGQDLRSRGLCLVPIETTYPVARETTADFWTPSFGGNFR